MQIIVNHLTRMGSGYVCVAGICVLTRSHIRPVTPGRRLPIAITEGHGGPFSIRNVIDLGEVRQCGTPPLIEDVEFRPDQAKKLGQLKQSEFWELLNNTARRRLKVIFGDDLEQIGNSLTMLPGKGTASLGSLLPACNPDLSVTFGKIRLCLDDPDGSYDLSVTDLRLHNPEDNTPNWDAIADMQNRLRNGARSIVSVGLTKFWKKPGDAYARHWLQVNGIHLEND